MSNLSFGGPKDRPRGSICEPLMQTTTAGRVMLIHDLVLKGDVQELKKELEKDMDLLEARNSQGMTPLFQSVSCNNLECVQLLVTSGANIDTRDNVGRTPVALAAYQGWHDGLYYLLAKGANCLIADNCGRRPLHAATYFSDENSLEVLLQHLSLQDVEARDNEGMSALHWAAFHGRTGHVKLLVEKKADLLSRDTDGKLPLHLAAQNGFVSTCKIMLEASNSHNLVNGKDFSGKTPIHLAAAAGHCNLIVELTAVPHSNCEAEDNEGRTPLHWAAANGHVECVGVLLRLGCNKNAEDKHGGIPLDYAQQAQYSKCCQLLTDYDPNNLLDLHTPKESVVEKLHVPDIWLGSKLDEVRVTNGVASESQTELSDFEVQDILGRSGGTASVEVLVEMNIEEESPSYSDCLHPVVNGDSDVADCSSDEDSRYPPQMALTPVPLSPVPPVDGNHNNSGRPPMLPRFSFEEQVSPVVRPSVCMSSTLAPIKSKTMPDRLRINNIRPTPVKPSEIPPPSTTIEASLAPLKVTKAKQNSVPVTITPQHAGSSCPREVSTPEIENGKQLTRKGKLKVDPLTPSPTSDHMDKAKDKRPLAGNAAAGQILPVISDNLSHLTQVQGTRQDQIEARKKKRRKSCKNRSIPEDLDVTPSGDLVENIDRDTISDKCISLVKDKKSKKKKIRKVLSWNF